VAFFVGTNIPHNYKRAMRISHYDDGILIETPASDVFTEFDTFVGDGVSEL
jgi:hypothetical protein